MTSQKKKQRMANAEEIVRPKKKQRMADAEKSPYLLVEHGCMSPAFSVFKVEPYTDGGGGGDTPVSIPHRFARLKCKHNMSFVPFILKDRRWIVGVGSSSTTDHGPGTIRRRLCSCVFLTGVEDACSIDDELSSRTEPSQARPEVVAVQERRLGSVRRSSGPSHGPSEMAKARCEPESSVSTSSLTYLANAQEVDGRLTNCKWRRLKRPPFFPWELTPGQYVCPPSVTVKSYVAVGSRILVFVTGKVATYAFDTNSNKWSTVDDKKSLPFVQGAIPHSPGLFLALSRTRKAMAGYKINVDGAGSLSVVEIPVVSYLEDDELVARSHNFLSLGIDRGFCLMTCWSVDETWDAPHLRAHIRVRTYTTDDFVESEGKLLVVSKQWMQVYKIRDLIRTLDAPCLVGVISI